MFNKTIFFLISLINILLVVTIQGQPYSTSSAHIQVEASTSFLTIDTDNSQVKSLLDIATGQIVFEGELKDFEFGMSGMSTLFTNKFSEDPNFLYKGTILNIEKLDLHVADTYPVNFKGILEFGSKKRTIPGKGAIIIKEDGSIAAAADLSFMISEQTVKKMNELIASYLPFGFGMSMNQLGFSRKVKVVINGDYGVTASE